MKPSYNDHVRRKLPAAAFGRLCVETLEGLPDGGYVAAAAFGRLCVETKYSTIICEIEICSRLRAAVC